MYLTSQKFMFLSPDPRGPCKTVHVSFPFPVICLKQQELDWLHDFQCCSLSKYIYCSKGCDFWAQTRSVWSCVRGRAEGLPMLSRHPDASEWYLHQISGNHSNICNNMGAICTLLPLSALFLGVAAAGHLPPYHCIPTILFCLTIPLHVLLHYNHKASLWFSSFLPIWQLHLQHHFSYIFATICAGLTPIATWGVLTLPALRALLINVAPHFEWCNCVQ